MRYSELKRILIENGCTLYREGRSHEKWISPITNQKFVVPRHNTQEVPIGTLKNIMRSAGIE